MRIYALLICVIVPFQIQHVECFSAFELFKISEGIVLDLIHAWDLMAPQGFEENKPLLPLGTSEKRLMTRMMDISRELAEVDRRVKYGSEKTMQTLSYDLPDALKYENRISELLKHVAGIEKMHDLYNEYLATGVNDEFSNKTRANKNKIYLERATLENFAESVVAHYPNTVRGMMDNIHNIIMRDSHSSTLLNRVGLLHEMRYLTEIGSSLCTIEQSPQQLLFNLYATVQLTQLKAYTMIQFSWMLLRIYNKGNFTLESNMMKQKYLQRTFQQAIAAKKAMEGAKREYWRCDPRRHIEGKTYTELTKLNQGFIVNEVDLNDQKSCKEDCPNYKMTKQYGCYKDNYCVEQPRCNGKIVNCQYIDSDMWVCPSDVSSKRRYDWVEYENGHTLGLKRSCSRKITKVDSWWRWLFWHCSFCFCHCDDPNDVKSDRYFNLRSVTSKTSENKVITGLRFVKSDRVIHLQIQEGTMLPKGEINESSVAWRPVDSYNVKDAKEGKDYHIINYEQRAIDLDDLLVPEEHVLTGVRFRKVGKHLNFEIQATKFNYETGNLRGPGDRSQWISNDNTDGAPEKPRTRLHLERPDIPTRSPALAVPDSKSDQYLEFTSTDIDSDAAQNTVPFIDIMEVAPKPPVPLAGAGIYHKGQRWYGGFIAPKVFTYDFTNHIDINKLRKDMNTK